MKLTQLYDGYVSRFVPLLALHKLYAKPWEWTGPD
jgi:hypothetical protein